MAYQKRQAGLGVILVLLVIAGVVLDLDTRTHAAGAIAIAELIFLIVLATVFSSLTIRVTNDEIEWWLAFRYFRGRVPLSEIETVTARKFNPLLSLGWHVRRRGSRWLVSGDRAVEITHRNGWSTVLSTDDPDALIAAIERAKG